jgi:hypothetical protein
MEVLSAACLFLITYVLVRGALTHSAARERAKEARRAQLRAASRAIRLSPNPPPRSVAFRVY